MNENIMWEKINKISIRLAKVEGILYVLTSLTVLLIIKGFLFP
jgi:hypothetical protein